MIRFADGTEWDIDRIKLEVLKGSDLGEAINGFSSADVINGEGGDDFLGGLDGDDVLMGGSGADALHGSNGNDILSGGADNDTLIGGIGNDILDGGTGDDMLNGGTGDNAFLFGWGDGNDVIAELPYVEAVPGRVNTLRFKAGVEVSDVTVSLGGKDLVVRLAGSSDELRIKQFANDLYSPVQRLEFADGTVWDKSATLQAVFAGTERDDFILGTEGGETIHGRDGNDSLRAEGGDDVVLGDAGNDHLMGGGGADTLDGGSGDDIMWGQDDNNTYLFGRGDGRDIIYSDYWYGQGATNTLRFKPGVVPADVEARLVGDDLVLSIIGTQDQVTLAYFFLTGSPVNSVNPIQRVEFPDGTVWEPNYIVSIALTMDGTAGNDLLTGTGNDDVINGLAGNDVIRGHAGNDRLIGGAGADQMEGGTGDDSYVVDSSADVISESHDGGIDTVESSVTFTLGQHVENLSLTGSSGIAATGNEADNVIIGNAGANRIDGKGGADTMTGGAGNDTYVVDRVEDTVIESSNAGTDLVESTVSYALASNVENLTLKGSSNINATGNSAANVLRGNTGANTLNGLAGADTMHGDLGDDVYIVDNTGDTANEASNAGIDRVESSVTFTLGSNLESLTLTGSSAINGTGNTAANILIGNGGNNTLAGLAGNDTYEGGAGNDSLTDNSTSSNDVYRWGRGQGADRVSDAGGTDRLDVLAGVTAGQLWLRRDGNHLELSVIGTLDEVTINNWYSGSANRVESFKLADGKTLSASKVQVLVDAMASFAPPASGQTTLPATYQTTLNPIIAANWI